jgi:hypothetical protein
MDKIYLKGVCIVSVYDYKEFEKTFLGEFLSGVVIEDETFRFRPFEQIVTSKIVSKNFVGSRMEIITHNGSLYSLDNESKLFSLTPDELAIMRSGRYSPETILEMRKQP